MHRYVLALLTLSPAPPAFAEPPRAQHTSSLPSAAAELDNQAGVAGFRLNTTGEFQLVEHGYWAPLFGPRQAEKLAIEDRANRLSVLPPKIMTSRGTNFRRAGFLPHVYAAEARFALPRGLLDALIWTESRYNPVAVSHAGAAGLGQLMPGTARQLGVVNRFDAKSNIFGAARYLRQMLDRFGVVHLALAAYNAGPGAVARARGIPLNGETPSYVRKVIDRWSTN